MALKGRFRSKINSYKYRTVFPSLWFYVLWLFICVLVICCSFQIILTHFVMNRCFTAML